MSETVRSEDTERNPYEKIINLPRHISKKRKKMSISDRAAQFSSFKALTGFEEEIAETAKETQEKNK